MSLTVGTRLGPYDIVAPIGAGGMGEVYRARDTKLNREVAIKVLPDFFATDPDRLARFTREAQTLASLNHPNIAAIYGVEESSGVRALVMELVEGEDLSQRIARGAIPLDEALPIARQIAEALEAAHEQGIIHRDLKPANLKVRSDGMVKVLDFGLAKAMEPVGKLSPGVTQSLTITSPAMMTGVGMILGTAAYMAPEQAKGQAADKRSDIWAFGCVVYEVLTGTRAFGGDDVPDTLANVLKSDPDWAALPTVLPGSIRTLLRRCLVKDRKRRLDSAAAARLEIDDALSMPVLGVGAIAAKGRPLAGRRAAMLMIAALASASVAATTVWLATRPAPPPVVHTTVTTSGSSALSLDLADVRHVVITPDGVHVVYRGINQLLVRALDQLEPTVLSGLGSPRNLFISPDGHWIGFVDAATIKKVAVTGGPPVTVSGSVVGNPRGAAWSPDGTIIFATDASTTGLQRVPATGGEPSVLTKPDRDRGEGDHFWPEFLPDGSAVLFTIVPVDGALANAQIAVLDLRTGRSKVLINGGSHGQYVSTGHLVYGVTGTLRAVAFDLGRLEVVGPAAPVLEGVLTTASGGADAAVAANGSLVYVRGEPGTDGQQTIVSVDRQGRGSPLPALLPDSYRDIRISRDGARLAMATLGDVWTYDFVRETRSRLTTDPAPDTRPLWTPDGQRIVFTSRRAGYPELFWRAADGTGRDERLLTRAQNLLDLRANDWSADGGRLVFSELLPSQRNAIWQTAIGRASDPSLLLTSEDFSYRYAAISPDGRWIAYESSMSTPRGEVVSEQPEVYVERYPELGDRQQISTGGGRLPLWSRDGRELFFSKNNRQMLVVPVQLGTTLVVGRPQVLFEFPMFVTGGSQPYDITPDGRFLVIQRGQVDTERSLILVQNWNEELKRLVPTK